MKYITNAMTAIISFYLGFSKDTETVKMWGKVVFILSLLTVFFELWSDLKQNKINKEYKSEIEKQKNKILDTKEAAFYSHISNSTYYDGIFNISSDWIKNIDKFPIEIIKELAKNKRIKYPFGQVHLACSTCPH